VAGERRSLTRDDVASYVAEHCFTGSETTRVGLELEFLTFCTADHTRRPLLDAMRATADAAALPAGGRVTFEPGGQLEISTVPCADTSSAIAAAQCDVDALTTAMCAIDVELVAVGRDRWRRPERLVDTPRYRAMEAWFDRAGREGRHMMCNTAAIQLNLDFGRGAAGVKQWRAAHAIGPALIAAFANSPGGGWKSARLATWFGIDRRRAAPVAGSDPASAWTAYALAAPAFVGGDRATIADATFGEWLDAGLASCGFPDEEDFKVHLTTLFPPIRPRGWLEIRYLDALPSPWWETATLVTAALLGDDLIDDALRAVAGTESLWEPAARDGLDDGRLAAAADECFALAAEATGDERVADYLERYVSKRVPAWA
jgi:glutamate--cysteine ligase